MTVSEFAICAQCGREFTRRGGRGRPARYCGSVCRRASEYQLNRVQGLLRRAEQRSQDAGLAVAVAVDSRYGRGSAAEAVRTQVFWAGEVERLKVELRRLLEASEAAPSYPKSA